MATLNLFDLITLQHNDIFTGLIEDKTTYAPELSILPVTVRPGITYKVASRTALPTAGFRAANSGLTPTKSTFKQQIKEMFYSDCQVAIDEMIVKGDDRSVGDLISIEAQGALQSTLINVGSQTYYGQAGDGSNGFVGLRAQMVATASVGGTTNSTTAYFTWTNPHWGVGYDIGRDGAIAMTPPERLYVPASALNSGASGNLWAWCTNISFFIGLSVKSQYSVYGVTGITNATTGSGAGYFPNGNNTVLYQAMTDRAAAQLVSSIPLVRRKGLVVFMNPLAQYTLQQSRSSLNFQVAGSSGTPAWSSRPVEVEGFPIVVTDSITNTENNT